MLNLLTFCCIVLPILVGIVIYCTKSVVARKLLVPITVGIMAISAVALGFHGGFRLEMQYFFGIPLDNLFTLLELLLLVYILVIGWRLRNKYILGMTVLQLVGVIYLKTVLVNHSVHITGLVADGLSLIMVIIISIVGGLITIYGLGYMDNHESHLKLAISRQPRFFAIIFLFLGSMNGLVLCNNLSWLFFFWEVTTLCSFLLIGHDGTDIAKANAERALWMNVLGGLAFISGILFLQKTLGTLSIETVLLKMVNPDMKTTGMLLPFAFLCLAAFTKSAQIPFESWLRGAMVAPTPVSALLHSATMVKAGTYLLIRLAPAFAGTTMSTMVSLFGAFTFGAACMIACSQSNGKKILAYSTIGNLGLIIACVGINTSASLSAATMILIYHSISKGLLFMCVGSIEQYIGSRDIEDMRGLYSIMPRATLITTIGIFTMMLPPFGMLVGKWMAIEAIAQSSQAMTPIILFVALGSAFTVLFWARWAGVLVSSFKLHEPIVPRDLSSTVIFSLYTLCGVALFFSLISPFVLNNFVDPSIVAIYSGANINVDAVSLGGSMIGTTGQIWIYLLFVLLGLGVWFAYRTAKRTPDSSHSLPYFSGLETVQNGEVGFKGPMNVFEKPVFSNYYLSHYFGEEKMGRIVDLISTAFLVVLVGGLL